MNKRFFYDIGGHIQERVGDGPPRIISFPICLAIRYGNNLTAECPNFVLDIDELWVFVRTETPLPDGTRTIMHFYIPPEIKLLAEIQGVVSDTDRRNAEYPTGMFIKFSDVSRTMIKQLKGYIEGKNPLVNGEA